VIELRQPDGSVARISHAIPGAYLPSAWGQKYHDLTVDEALGGGSAGPGKSLVLLMDANDQIILQHLRCEAGEFRWGQAPGWALHLRKEFPRLEQTIDRAHRLFYALDPEVQWERNAHKFTFKSGYQYQFGHLKDKDSYLNYRSNEYTALYIDEIGEIEEKDSYDELVLRVRSTDRLLKQMLRVRSMSNPCANWVREHFVDPNPQGGEVIQKEIKLSTGQTRTRSRIFLPARLSDNPDPEFQAQYEANLKDRPVHIKRALFDGDWYVVPGAFFAELWDSSRIVVKPFEIPSGWRRFRTGDWGYKDKCVILWWAVHPDGALICYRERVWNGAKAKKLYDAYGVACKIREVESAHREWNKVTNRSRLGGWMDTQLWEERGHRGRSMADDMAQVGVFWSKTKKGRVSSAQQMIKRLNWRGYDDMPGVMFFDECKYCISTIPALGTDETEPEAPKEGGEDHGWAAVSYAVAMNPLPSGQDDRNPYDDDDDERGLVTDYVAGNRGAYGYGQN
jgi:hypothetical protein